jgi:hypothetical protein
MSSTLQGFPRLPSMCGHFLFSDGKCAFEYFTTIQQ